VGTHFCKYSILVMERITSEEDRTLKLVFCDEVGEMVVKLTGLHVLNLAIPKGFLSCPLFDILFPLDPNALDLLGSGEPGELVFNKVGAGVAIDILIDFEVISDQVPEKVAVNVQIQWDIQIAY
jgi:hypothetical protein